MSLKSGKMCIKLNGTDQVHDHLIKGSIIIIAPSLVEDRLGAGGKNHSDTDTFQDYLGESLMLLFFTEENKGKESSNIMPEPWTPMEVRN
jgi:hypothetical protein